jgi:hypothetical protein
MNGEIPVYTYTQKFYEKETILVISTLTHICVKMV